MALYTWRNAPSAGGSMPRPMDGSRVWNVRTVYRSGFRSCDVALIRRRFPEMSRTQSPSSAAVHPGAQQPSPVVHVVIGVQVDGAPAQVVHASTTQFARQPSPSALLPSSHCSPGSTVPSPHAAVKRWPKTWGVDLMTLSCWLFHATTKS